MVKTAKGFVVFRRNGAKVEYLLLQACYGIQHWTPPKGHVEKGEVEFETAYRETNEETGLVKTDYKVIDEYKQELNYLGKKGKPKIVIYWLAELINQDAEIKLSHEHINYIWASLDQACELIEFEETRGLIKRFTDWSGIKTLLDVGSNIQQKGPRTSIKTNPLDTFLLIKQRQHDSIHPLEDRDLTLLPWITLNPTTTTIEASLVDMSL